MLRRARNAAPDPALARAGWRSGNGAPEGWIGWTAADAAWPWLVLGDRLGKTLGILGVLFLMRGEATAGFFLFIWTSYPRGVLEALFRPRRRLPVAALLTLPPPATPYPCRIEVQAEGALLGKDVGIVTFLDGWLHFEGHRTAFSLRRAEMVRRDDGRLDFPGGRVVFEPQDRLDAEGLAERDLKKRFAANLAAWWQAESPDGASILPPAVPHPTGIVRARLDLAASLVLLGVAGTILVANTSSDGWAWLLALPYATGTFVAVRRFARVRRGALPRPAVE